MPTKSNPTRSPAKPITPATPPSPANATVDVAQERLGGGTDIQGSWDTVPGADSYEVELIINAGEAGEDVQPPLITVAAPATSFSKYDPSIAPIHGPLAISVVAVFN